MTCFASCQTRKNQPEYCKIQHFVNLRRNHPELWAELVELSHTPNLCSYGFKYGLTVQEVEKRMNAEEQQLKLF